MRLFSSILMHCKSYVYHPYSGAEVQRHAATLQALDKFDIKSFNDFLELASEFDYKFYMKIKQVLMQVPDLKAEIDQNQELMTSGACRYLASYDVNYPHSLHVLEDCPLGMFYQGSLEHLRRPGVAVIGSRKASALAIASAEKVGYEMAKSGISVISGGAIGCDIAAHWGVLQAKQTPCPAITVFASGLERLYPKQNYDIFSTLKEYDGLFLSEKPPSLISRAYDFPKRNRLVVALAQEIFIAQCGLKSGAMNSAMQAMAVGRDITVLRQKEDIRADGCEKLISEGISWVDNVDEYLYG